MDDRYAQWTVTITATHLRNKGAWIASGPDRFTGLGVEGFYDLAIVQTVKKNTSLAGHCDAGVSTAYVMLPDNSRTVCGPGIGQTLIISSSATTIWSENLWPIAGKKLGRRDDNTQPKEKPQPQGDRQTVGSRELLAHPMAS